MSNTRETKAYSKNFINGDIIETTKMKPISNMRAVHKIELFESGEKVQEVQAENFLSIHTKAWQEHWAKLAAVVPSSYTARGGSGPNYYFTAMSLDIWDHAGKHMAQQNRLHNLIGSSPQHGAPNAHSPIRWMLLTDDTAAEAPSTETLVKGNVIGYAYREGAYSGTDVFRGTWNENESYTQFGHAHFVYDFGTDKANGTFNSICWASEVGSGVVQHTGMVHEKYPVSAPTGYVFNSDHAAGYRRKGTDVVYVAVVSETDTNTKGIAKYTWNATNSVYDFTSVVAVAIGTDKLVSFDLTSTGEIFTQSVNNPGGGSVYTLTVKKWNADGTANAWSALTFQGGDSDYHGSHVQGVALVGDGFLAVNYGNNSYYSYTRTYNLADMTVVSTYGHPLQAQAQDLTYDSFMGKLFVNCAYYYWKYYHYQSGLEYSDYTHTRQIAVDSTTGGLTGEGTFNGYPFLSYDQGGSVYYFGGNRPCAEALSDEKGSSTATFVRGFLGTLGGRNLLPAAVTKSSSQTMKITYDLYIE